jgi:hypothetical protein
MKLLTGPDTRVASLLDHPADEVRIDPTWWSWSGAHGGLAVALAAAAMRRSVGEDVELRSVTAQLLAPIDGAARFDADVVRRGRSVLAATGTAVQDDRLRLSAGAVFGRPGRGPAAAGPPAPVALPPDELDPFFVPLDVLPFTAHIDVRPVGENRPFAGGTTAELTAWVRLTDDDRPVDELRTIVLLDCLAPPIAAVLPAMAAVPTVELSVHLAPAVRSATSPWVLIRTRTDLAVGDGWCSDRLDAWAPDGSHLASATQLRLVLG